MGQDAKQTVRRLFEAKVIDERGSRAALQCMKERGGDIEEALIESRAVGEEALLKGLAKLYRTRFVSTEKLRRADIPRGVLDKLPAKIATKYTLFPILFDPAQNALSLVCRDPSDLTLEQIARQTTGVRHVRLFVARPAAIRAAISKFYKGDIHAFANVDKAGIAEYQQMMDVYERQLLDEDQIVTSLTKERSPSERMITPREMEESAARTLPKRAASPMEATHGMTVGILRVMLSLLESDRGELTGHSVQTSQLVHKMCRRIGLAESETFSVVLSALLHDIGKGGPYHLTALNVAEWEGHRSSAEKKYDTPLRLFESLTLPEATVQAVRHMYERFDGSGFPLGLRGKDIPLGARVLALADVYADLTENSRNPYRQVLGIEEALAIIDKAKEVVFDPHLVELFRGVVAGNALKQKILTGAKKVLVVDSDPEQCAVLDLQLTSRGFKTRTARRADRALEMLSEGPFDLIIAEVELEPFDGFELKGRLSQVGQAGVPLVYYTSRADAQDVERGFELGAKDYIIKPSRIDIFVAKIQGYLAARSDERASEPGDAAAGGVSGSLKEMSLPDLVQIIAHGRKSGLLRLKSGDASGEIYFVKGDIYAAKEGEKTGEEAFFELLKLTDGSFSLNPSVRAQVREIEVTAEMLLLEGLRRVDEGNR